MRILHTADNHIDLIATRLGKYRIANGQNLVYQERLQRTRSIIEVGVKQNCDVFVFAGDLFNRSKPFPQEVADVCDLLDLIPEDKIVFIIPGNHDEITARGCALQPLQNRRHNIVVALELRTFSVQGFDFILAPWGTPFEKIKEARQAQLGSQYGAFPLPILIYHVGTTIEGLHWTEIEGEQGSASLSDIESLNCRAVLMGHYHGQKFLRPNIAYSGSPECYNFGETEHQKGFLIWDFEASKFEVTAVKTEYPSYVTLNPKEFLELVSADAYVRIQGSVAEQERLVVIEKLKTFKCLDYKLDLKSVMKEQKVYTIQGRSNREILTNFLESKKIPVTEELLQLDVEVERKSASHD